MAQPTCAVDGCDLEVKARGWCNLHYQRWRRCGDVLADVPIGYRWGRQASVCVFPGCDREPEAHDLCHKHARDTKFRHKVQRRPRSQPRQPRLVGGGEWWECTTADCGWHHRSRFYDIPSGRPTGRCKRCMAQATVERIRADRRIGQAYEQNRLRRLHGPGVTPAEWLAILDRFGHRCAWDCPCARGQAGCAVGFSLTQEHLIPVSRGGVHGPGNVVPACKSCNSAKHARTAEEWEAVGGRRLRLP